MSIESRLISVIVLVFIYFFCIVFKKYLINYTVKLKKIFFNNKESNTDVYLKIGKIYSFILLFLLILMTINSIYIKYHPYSTTVFLGENKQILKIGFPIFFFLLGLLCSNGKSVLCYLIDNYIYVVKSLILTGFIVNLLFLQKVCISSLMIAITLINVIMIIDYWRFFKSIKDNIGNIEFIFHFSWLSIINFLNSFLLIYNIFNI